MAMRQAACGTLLRRVGAATSSSSSSTACSSIATRGVTTVSLPDLPYDFGALEPVVSAKIMELHHGKHHAAYVANFNKASEAYGDADARGDVATMIKLQAAVKFNGGGVSVCAWRVGGLHTPVFRHHPACR